MNIKMDPVFKSIDFNIRHQVGPGRVPNTNICGPDRAENG